MESLDFINKILEGRLVLGAKETITDNLFIIPVYKVKISFLNLKTDIKSTNGDGGSGSINVTPICLIKSYNGNVELINLEEFKEHDSIIDSIPNILNGIDVNAILKNMKIM